MLPVLLATLAAPPALAFTGPARLVEPGRISTPAAEIKIAFSPDGTRALWGVIGQSRGRGGWDIWGSRRSGNAWTDPEPVAFNSESNDFDPAFAPDGRGVYFFSNRPGGLGGDDLWFAPLAPDGTWGSARNLGPGVNTPKDEWAPLPSPDGRRLLFASGGHGSRGGMDLFSAEWTAEGWGKPQSLGAEVNSAQDDFDAAWLHDGTTLVFTRKPRDRDEAALHLSTWDGRTYTHALRLGPEVNVEGGWNLGPAIHPQEPGVLYFTSHRPGNACGRADIYRIPYALPPAQAR